MSKIRATMLLMSVTLFLFAGVIAYEAYHHLQVGTSSCLAGVLR